MSYLNCKITIEFDSLKNEKDLEDFTRNVFSSANYGKENQIIISESRFPKGCKKPGCHCLDKTFGISINVKKIDSTDQFKQLKKDLFIGISLLYECPVFVEILSEVINEC
jgi:hypothetical protein